MPIPIPSRARAWLTALALAAGALLAPPGAAAQQCTEEPCGPLDFTPPQVTISPASGSYPAGPLSVRIDMTDDYAMSQGTFQVMYGPTNVTGNFTYVWVNGGVSYATGTVNVVAGSTTLTAEICDQSAGANCGYGTATYTGPSPSVRVAAAEPSLSVPAMSWGMSRYRVVNTGTATTTYTLTGGCTGGFGSCYAAPDTTRLAAGDSAWVDVYFVTPAYGGQVSLKAQSGSVSSTALTGISTLTAPNAGYPGDPQSHERIERDGCVTISMGPDVASECGDLRVVHALPTTRVLNRARTPVLTYNSDHARPHPVVAAHLAGPATVPDSIRAVLMVNGEQVASMRWRGWGADQTRRIALAFEASDPVKYATGLYPYTLQVTAEWLNGTQQSLSVQSGRMIIVNRSRSPFGAGWWLAGVEQITDLPGDSLKLWVGGDGSARLYRRTGTNRWRAQGYDGPDSLYVGTAGGGLGQVTVRTLPGKSEVWFDSAGRHVRTINLMQQYTAFRWNGGYLEEVWTPAKGDTARYLFEYNNNPAATVRNLSRVAAPGLSTATTRDTWLRTDATGRLLRIREPTGDSITYTYYTSTRWMTQRTDRRGATHGFSYIRVRFHTSYRRLTPTEIATTRVQAVQTLGMNGASVRADSVHVVFDGARPATEACDCIWWKVNRWGAPTSMRTILGQVTTYDRGDPRWPALVTRVTSPNGFSTSATYDTLGNPATTTSWNPYGDNRHATTTYTWHPRWNRPVRIVAPEGEVTLMAYDTTYGRRTWEQVGPDSVRRVRYAYNAATHATAPHQLATVTDPRGAVESYTYDVRGNVSAVTDPLTVTTSLLTDRLGRLVRTQVPVQTEAGLRYQQDSTVYNDRGQVRESISTGPAMSSTVGEQRLHVRNDYDKEGNLTQVERWAVPDTANVDTLVTRFEYDLGGRRIVEIAPDSTPANWADNPRDSTFYDMAGNVVRVRTRRFAESLAANPGDPSQAYIRMQYDALNRLTRRILPAVRYDARFGGMVGQINLGMGLHPYPYYPNDGNGLRIPADTSTFAYDPASGLQDRADNASALVRRRFYPDGSLRYDSLYIRTVEGVDFGTHAYGLEYRYDRDGRTTELGHPSQLRPAVAVSQGIAGNRFSYDRITGALLEVTDPMGNAFRYAYTLRGEPDSLVLPGRITQMYTYNLGGQLERHRIRNQLTGGNRYAGSWLRDETIQYDLRGKLVGTTNQYGRRDVQTITYTGLGQLAQSTHEYRGWYLDTNQDAAYTAIERPRHDALGNIVSMHRDGAVRVFDTSMLEAGHSRRDTTNGAFGYQPGSGRLMERADPGRIEFTHYDAGGNTVFITAAPPAFTAGEMLDRASFYDGGGRLWAVDVRRVANAVGRSPQYFTFEEYRLDALGRRVLVRARKHCERVDIDDRICSLGSVRRTVWAGDQELYEIQMPEDQAENDVGQVTGQPLYDSGFDPNLFFGRVAYTYGGAIDQPLGIVRMGYVDRDYNLGLHRWEDFAIIPHWDAHGRAESGTFHEGGRTRCRPGYTDWCVQLEWVDGMFPYNPSSRALEHWHGTLLTEKRDASGLLYRRHRYYDPGTGRFTQEDPLGLAGGVNVYGFAAGDPVSYADPYGLKICFKGSLRQVNRLVGALETATGSDITISNRCITGIEDRGGDRELQGRLRHLAFTEPRLTEVMFLANFRDSEDEILSGTGSVDDAWYAIDRGGGPNVAGVGSGWASVTYPTRTWLGGKCFPLGRRAQTIESILVHELLGHGYGSSRNNWAVTKEGPAIRAENRYHSGAGEPRRTGYC